MRTTLELPDPLFKEVKTRAVQQGVTLKDLLASYIEAGLRGVPAQRPLLPPGAKRPPLPVAIQRVPGAPLHPAMKNAELYAIMDAEDEVEYHRAISPSTQVE